MYIVSGLYCKNFMSFEETKYEVKQGLTTMVFGKNNDQEISQPNNGSGKSSLLEIISFGIMGIPLRKVKLEELINDSSDEGMTSVKLDNKALDRFIVINRYLSRKESQKAKIDFGVLSTGEILESPDITGREDADKWIIEKIGISKDEFHNNFILSTKRFKSFLSLSDSKMKEVINSFSRGNVVDEAIQRLKDESEPVKKETEKIDSKIAILRGSVDVLIEQIKASKESRKSRIDAKNRQIEQNKDKISDLRKDIRVWRGIVSEKLDSIKSRQKDLDDFRRNAELSKNLNFDTRANIINDYANKFGIDLSNECCVFTDSLINEVNHIACSSKHLEKNIKSYEGEIKELDDKIKLKYSQLKKLKTSLISSESDYNQLAGSISVVEADIELKRYKVKHIVSENNKLSEKLNELNNKLSGAIACPKCEHIFVLDENFDVEAGEIEADVIKGKISNLDISKAFIVEEGKEAKERLGQKELVLKKLSGEKSENEKKIKELQMSIDLIPSNQERIKSNIDRDRAKIDRVDFEIDKLIEDAISVIKEELSDEIELLQKDISRRESKIEDAENSIKNFESIISDIEKTDVDSSQKDLNKKVESLNKDLESLLKRQTLKNNEYNRLKEQENNFIDYKGFLANTKVQELNDMTNYYLDKFQSDLRVNISGFTKQKNGKIKEKISVKMLRDGVDAGSFSKFSDGEQARVLISNILAMADLVNMNCDAGKGFGLFCLDELMSAVDFGGNRFILKVLNEVGITCLMISHGLVEEGYENVTVVEKTNGVSIIKNI